MTISISVKYVIKNKVRNIRIIHTNTNADLKCIVNIFYNVYKSLCIFSLKRSYTNLIVEVIKIKLFSFFFNININNVIQKYNIKLI